MRDVLTILAAAIIVVLTVALAIPPFLDWRPYRGVIDGAVARAVGAEAASDGALEVRLLPTPRLRLERLRIGPEDAAHTSLRAAFVRAEIALTPLLAGEIRVLDARIGRAEVIAPATSAESWRLPRRYLADDVLRRAFAIDRLRVAQLVLTTTDATTGRTDQASAEGVQASAGSLAGPWRIEGMARAMSFEIVLGELGPDGTATLKAGAGGGERPRLDLDARLDWEAGEGDTLRPRLAGTARLGTAKRANELDPQFSVAAQTAFKASGSVAELTDVSLEAGQGARAVRLGGSGRLDLSAPRLRLDLSARRADLASLLADAGGWAGSRLPALRDAFVLPTDWNLRLDAAALGGDDDLTAVEARVTSDAERVEVRQLTFGAPGGTRVRASGEIGLGAGGPTVQATVAATSQESDRLARFLTSLSRFDVSGLLDGRPLDLSADLTAADPVVSVRNLRATLGDTSLTGALRHTRGEGSARPRVDAQLAVQNVDLARLPEGRPVFDAARSVDFGLILDARQVGYGGRGNGRVSARFSTEGAVVLIERMELVDLAGAAGSLSGRLEADGSGAIEGRLQARRAAPLLDVFGRIWLGGAVRLVPEAGREGAVDVSVRAARTGAAGPNPTLRTTVSGTLAGGSFQATTLTGAGLLREVSASLSTDRTGAWLGVPAAPGLARPGRMSVTARREGGRLTGSLAGDLAGLRLTTAAPLRLGPDDDRLVAGAVEIASDDAAAFAASLSEGAAVRGPVPVALRLVVDGEPMRLAVTGRLAGADLSADLTGSSRTELAGSVTLSRLSLPWLAAALALNAPAPTSGPGWPSGRFGRKPELPVGGAVRVTARAFQLSTGLEARDAAFELATTPDGFAVRDLRMTLGPGTASGSFSLVRQGGLASLIGDGEVAGLALPSLIGQPLAAGSLSGSVRFGASGESLAGLVSNLGGAGTLNLSGFRVEAADPGAPERAASRSLRGDDPLASDRLNALVAEELARGPLTAPAASANLSLVGGSLRASPLRLQSPAGAWEGSAAIDLRALTIEARGSLASATNPRRWAGGPPAVTLGWSGPLSRPVRTLDAGPLINGLASAVLQRELERIDVFELDAAERARLNARVEMDRRRRADAEEAERQRRLREEAAERARIEAERARAEAERARLEAERARNAADFAPPERRSPPPDSRPPAQSGASGG